MYFNETGVIRLLIDELPLCGPWEYNHKDVSNSKLAPSIPYLYSYIPQNRSIKLIKHYGRYEGHGKKK